MWYITASVISGVLGTLTSFLLHKYVVFQKRQRVFSHMVRYGVVVVFDLAAITGVLYICVHFLGIPEEIAKVIANVSVVLWNYFAFKFFVYV